MIKIPLYVVRNIANLPNEYTEEMFLKDSYKVLLAIKQNRLLFLKTYTNKKTIHRFTPYIQDKKGNLVNFFNALGYETSLERFGEIKYYNMKDRPIFIKEICEKLLEIGIKLKRNSRKEQDVTMCSL